MASSTETKEKPNGEVERNVFTLLKQHDVTFNSHVQLILEKLGFTCLRSFALLDTDKIPELEESVVTLLGSKRRLEQLNEQDRLALFGEFFADDPAAFRFLPGERNSIVAAVQTSQKLLTETESQLNSSQHIIYLKEESPEAPKGKRPRASLGESTPKSTPKRAAKTPKSGNQSWSLEPEIDENNIIKRKGKSLDEYLRTWLASTKHPVMYSPNDWVVSDDCDTISCTVCKTKPFKVCFDKRGGWKPSTFFRHLILFHGDPNRHAGDTLIVEIESDSMDESRAIASIVEENSINEEQ